MAGRFTTKTVFQAVDRFSRPVAKMQGRMDLFQRTGNRMARNVSGAFGNVARTLSRVTLVFGAAGAAAAYASARFLKAGADYEQAITNVGAVGLRTRQDIAELDTLAQRLGATTKFTATESANAMEILAKAGFANQQILSATPGVLNAAAASGLEMAEVANVVSNALKGMGLEATQAGHVADVLALASARTNSTIGSLGESLSNVSSTARQLSIPFEDVVTSVALLQDVGLDASVAGSAMNTMLTKLAKPTKGLEHRMKRLGVQLKDSQGDLVPLPMLLSDFGKAAQKSGGNLEVVAFFADLVGLRGQKAATNLKDLFESGKFSALSAELTKASGKAEEMAELRLDTLQGDVVKLKSAWEAVRVGVFEGYKDDLREITQLTTELIRENQSLLVSMASDPAGGWREATHVFEDWIAGYKLGVGSEAYEEWKRMADQQRVDAYSGTDGSGPRTVDPEFARNYVAPVTPPLLPANQQPPSVLEIKILDDTGRAEVTKKPKGSTVHPKLSPSGAF